MIIQGSHAPCPIPYHTFFPNRMLIGKLMYPLRLSKTYPSFLNLKEDSTFLTKPLFNGLYTPFGSPVPGGQKPQEREDVTALLGAQNRYAIRLADQSGLRHVLRDGTAWGINSDGKATSQLQR